MAPTVEQWAPLALQIAAAKRLVDKFGVGAVDQKAADTRDLLDRMGISVADPVAVHAVIVGAALIHQNVYAQVAKGQLPLPFGRVVEIQLHAIIASLLDAIPAEGRP